MGTVRGILGDTFGVIGQGAGLLVRHWPTLVVLYLLGNAGHGFFLRLAVWVSDDHPLLAWLVLPLAPLASLTALVLSLRLVAGSLPHTEFGTARDGERGRRGLNLVLLASVLIPFVTVYAAQGYLEADYRAFVYHVWYDETYIGYDGEGQEATVDRANAGGPWAVLALAVVAFGLRFLLSKLKLPQRSSVASGLAVWLEVSWIMLLAHQLASVQDVGWTWLRNRRFVAWVTETWSQFIDVLGVVGQPVQAVADRIGGFLAESDDLLLIPLAWLTVGAVVLGSSLVVPPRERRPRPWDRPVAKLPGKVRDFGSDLAGNVTSRFTGLADAFRLLALGGLVPMLLFCIVFVVAIQSGQFAGEVWRWIVGPRAFETGVAFYDWQAIVSDGAEKIVLVVLLAAAIDHIFGRTTQASGTSVSAMR